MLIFGTSGWNPSEQVDSFIGIGTIYLVTSRGDFQAARELKEVESIYQKILREREGSEGPPKRAPKPDYKVENVPDIIGTRVVCIYPTDIKTVAEYVRKNKAFVKYDDEPKSEGGYTAHHFTVNLAEKPQFSGLICEIQIRTMLLEAYYYKTHELTYKGEFAKPEDKERAALLNNSLEITDQQSESLKRQIMKRKEIEDKNREIARHMFMKKLTKMRKQDCAKPTLIKNITAMRDFIKKNEQKIIKGNQRSLNSINRQVIKYKDTNGVDRNLCRILALLAAIAKTEEFEGLSLDSLDELISQSKAKNKEIASSYTMKATACYCFGKIDQAYKLSQLGLEDAINRNDKRMAMHIKANAAYFIAESCDRKREREARQYIIEALESEPMNSAFLDTLGFINIMFGKDYDEVRRGLDYCEAAYEENPDKEIGGIYLNIHRLIASAQMLEFTEQKASL